MKKEEQRTEKALKNAKRNLQKARDEIAAAAGNRESEARSRIERKEQAERKLAEAKDMERAAARLVQGNFDKYEEVAPKLVQAKEDTNATESSFNTARHRLSDLKKNDGNKLSVYGQKTVDMCSKIDEGRRRRQFQGQVIGPIGLHVKIKPGEEQFAGIAELALGSANLGRFIVTEDADRATLMRFRRELGCNTRECNVYQIVSIFFFLSLFFKPVTLLYAHFSTQQSLSRFLRRFILSFTGSCSTIQTPTKSVARCQTRLRGP